MSLSFVRHRTMDSGLLKILGTLISPVKWLYHLCTDQTRIEIVLPQAENWNWDSIPVQDTGNETGLFMFGVSTKAKQDVEITRIEVLYAAPLQLLDPGNRGFFIGAGTLDSDLPFCVYWNGSAAIRSDVQQSFALSAHFPHRLQDCRIRIAIHARRRHSSIGGFVTEGRCHVSTSEYRIRLVSQRVLGLRVPPLCWMTTPQPFLIEGAVTASTLPGQSCSVITHTRDADGNVASTKFGVPDA